jgi:hypothetical protein
MTLSDLMHHLAVAIVKADAALDQFRLSTGDEEPEFIPQPSAGEVVMLLVIVFVWLPLRLAWYRLGQLRERVAWL